MTGKVWLRFSCWAAHVGLDYICLAAMSVLQSAFRNNSSWAGEVALDTGAADAWAGASLAGLGGWFRSGSG